MDLCTYVPPFHRTSVAVAAGGDVNWESIRRSNARGSVGYILPGLAACWCSMESPRLARRSRCLFFRSTTCEPTLRSTRHMVSDCPATSNNMRTSSAGFRLDLGAAACRTRACNRSQYSPHHRCFFGDTVRLAVAMLAKPIAHLPSGFCRGSTVSDVSRQSSSWLCVWRNSMDHGGVQPPTLDPPSKTSWKFDHATFVCAEKLVLKYLSKTYFVFIETLSLIFALSAHIKTPVKDADSFFLADGIKEALASPFGWLLCTKSSGIVRSGLCFGWEVLSALAWRSKPLSFRTAHVSTDYPCLVTKLLCLHLFYLHFFVWVPALGMRSEWKKNPLLLLSVQRTYNFIRGTFFQSHSFSEDFCYPKKTVKSDL